MPHNDVMDGTRAAAYLRQSAQQMLAYANELDPVDINIEASGSPGAALIAQERVRQISVEGYTPEHDALHADNKALAWGAFCYLERAAQDKLPQDDPSVAHLWPFDRKDWKPKPSRIRNLTVAGALIAADIDRRYRNGERP